MVRERCTHHGLPIPHVSVEPGRSIAGPSMVMLYRVGVVKDVSLEDGGVRRYVAIDGGMSDNIRPVLYDATYTATLANRDPAQASSWRAAASSASTARAATSSSATSTYRPTLRVATCWPCPPSVRTATRWHPTTTC